MRGNLSISDFLEKLWARLRSFREEGTGSLKEYLSKIRRKDEEEKDSDES